ncbi:prion-inhibition and propagation-domain-containing protein [Annulohypoxylon truncatum]|uniref:prion-inhibition and propagation-domain-containing protein n=1 Tax=Annulohypoxylon truncatum TaxID=327061 RepID=UPI002007F5BE|nr:prion-inhibition and propagation-domain-containing protein [Annulohypoxylon truncatum]KAI1214106.1 prion-inhibition and propagation-domain-containing protein [Annulohypoxylon truncatum]
MKSQVTAMDLGAAGVSFASLALQLFQGCVQGFIFFNTAQHIGEDGGLFRAGLEFEKYRLISWARKAGLLEEDANPSPRVSWQLATMLLEQLSAFVTSADKLAKKYALSISEEAIEERERAFVAEPPKQGLAKLLSRLKPEIYSTSGKIIQANNGAMKRMRWAATGKDNAKRIIREIHDLIDKLESLLDSIDRESRRVEDTRLLRNLVSLSTTATEVIELRDMLGSSMSLSNSERAIRAAAYVKQIRLTLGADRREDEVQPVATAATRSIMPPLKVIKKSLKAWSGVELQLAGIEFARYNNSQVIVQWKIAEGTFWEKYKDQMKSLAVLLMSFSHTSFRSPQCIGYYPGESLGRHAIVFSLPEGTSSLSMKSLSQLISEEKAISLSRRLAIARALAETILQLHTAGWMHKGLTSENIIFLAPEGSQNEDFLRSEPLVMGYDYARPDTADAAVAFTQLPESKPSAELYRHPQARGLARETYQKRFDLYALGCLFVELALWQLMADVHTSFTTNDLVEKMAKAVEPGATVIDIPTLSDLLENDGALASMKHQAGEQIVEVISTCCYINKAEDGKEAALDEQLKVLEVLSQCKL